MRSNEKAASELAKDTFSSGVKTDIDITAFTWSEI